MRTVEPESANPSRRVAILDAAVQMFTRYGYKKTSMDDVARAAGLSRQGLYLHFATKESLFKDAVRHLIDGTLAAGRAALGREDLGVEARLLGALEALHGPIIGKPGAENLNELMETATRLSGASVSDFEASIVLDLSRVLRASPAAAEWKRRGISAKDLAENLYATSCGVKHRAATAAEYRARMRVAVQMACGEGASRAHARAHT